MKRRMNSYLLAGMIITGLMLLVIVIGAFWTPYVPTAMKYGKFNPPSAAHLFGTDNFGRDIFSRVIKGSGTTLAIALSTVSIGAIIGTLVGAVTGYFGGLVDDVPQEIPAEAAPVQPPHTLPDSMHVPLTNLPQK